MWSKPRQTYDPTTRYSIYTTLDLDLQRAATEAVHEGMKLDEQISKQNRPKKSKGEKNPAAAASAPQAAPRRGLVAL